MNKYGCSRFCNHYKSVSPYTDCGGWVICEKSGCEIDMNRMILLQEVGCASHSEFQSDRDMLKQKYNQLMAASINNENPGWVQIVDIEKILNPFEGITPDIENLQEFPFRSYPKKVSERLRHDCYNCGTFCDYQMINGTGSITKDAVEHRREIHNGEKCSNWSESSEKRG